MEEGGIFENWDLVHTLLHTNAPTYPKMRFLEPLKPSICFHALYLDPPFDSKRELLSLTEKSVNHSLINISNLYFSLFHIQKIHLWYKERLVYALEI